jgi:hypothetical protein
MHSYESEDKIEYKKQMRHFKKASLFHMNDGLSKNQRKTYQILAKSILSESGEPKMIEE